MGFSERDRMRADAIGMLNVSSDTEQAIKYATENYPRVPRETVERHPTFQKFKRWEGVVPAGFHANAVGQLINVEFLRGFGWATPDRMVARFAQGRHDALGEETFEWLTMFDAILEARGTFTMVELGAGFGRWLVSAACAARMARPHLKMKLVGVEAEHIHFEWMRQHFRDNGLNEADHRLIRKAVWTEAGESWLISSPDPSGFWGQYVTSDPANIAHHVENSFAWPIDTTTLEVIIDGLPYIDLIDMDIQDAEKTVVPANIDLLTSRVRRVFIETHWPETHRICDQALRDAGWQIIHSFPPSSRADTEFGPLDVGGGGVLTAVNPKTAKMFNVYAAKVRDVLHRGKRRT